MSDHKSPDAYDKLSDTLDKKLLDFNIGMLKVVAAMLVRPLAMCTEPFFRKNFGERYFTENTFIVSMAIWIAGASLLNLVYGQGQEGTPLQNWLYYKLHFEKLAVEIKARYIVNVVCFLYSYMAFKQLVVTRMRQRTGHIWHSMSRGESLFGKENAVRDMIIAAIIVGVLWIAAPHLCAIFVLSQVASYYLSAKQQSSIYSRYLDQMDAKIEAEHFQETMDKGVPPKDTDGLYAPLPKRFKGEFRTRIARVASGGPFDPNAPDQRAAVKGSASVASVSPSQTRPAVSQPSSQITPDFIDAVLKFKQIVTSKGFIRVAVIIMVLAGLAYAGTAIIQYFNSHTKPAVVASVAPSRPNQPQVIPAESPPVAQPVPTTRIQESESPPTQAAPPVAAPAPPPVDTAALERAALEKQRQEEQARLARQHQQSVDQFNTTLSQKVAELAQAQADSNARLNNYTNKIAKASWLRRGYLRRDNLKARELVKNELQNQQDTLNLLQDSMRSFSSDTNADPNQVVQTIQAYDETTAAISRNINLILQKMDDEISGNDVNSGNSGLIQVR